MTEIVSEEQFEQEALAFLEANAKLRVEEKTGWGQGSDNVALFAEKTHQEEAAEVDAAKAWRRLVFDAGFGWISGPKA
jgi:hypothetical protein